MCKQAGLGVPRALRFTLVKNWHLIALVSIGICLVTLNLSVLDILKSKSCIDSLIQTTIAAVKADHDFQLTWMILVLLGNTTFWGDDVGSTESLYTKGCTLNSTVVANLEPAG